MVWGWIVAMIFIQSIAMGMAELCSAMPTRYGRTRLSSDYPRLQLTRFPNSAAAFTMQQQCWPLRDTARWLLGLLDGPTGSDRSQQRRPSIMPWLR